MGRPRSVLCIEGPLGSGRGRLERRGETEEKEETAVMVMGQDGAGAGTLGTGKGSRQRESRGWRDGAWDRWLWDKDSTWGSASLTEWTNVLSLR